MRALELTATLAGFERRGPGTDAERRAARRLATDLFRGGFAAKLETFWCRPNWALAHAWHVALALAGSLLSVSQPALGAGLLGIALLSITADEVTGLSPGRRLTPERASQNLLATPATTGPATGPATGPTAGPATEAPADKTRLVITANYDAGRTALVYRDALRRPAAALRRIAGPLALGWLAWLSLAITWSLAVAVIRAAGHHSGHILGVIQFPPTAALVLALALLLEAAAASYGPGANDNASGAAVALAAAQALAANPPAHLAPELVLTGAGEGGGIGLRRHLRSRRHELTRANTIVVGIAPCGGGELRCWLSDGRLIPLRYARPLQELAADLEMHRGRGAAPPFVARARGLPALALGCLDPLGLAPRSHQPSDTEAEIDERALTHAVEMTLRVVDEIDGWLSAEQPAATPA
jgi:Peptidase family M28